MFLQKTLTVWFVSVGLVLGSFVTLATAETIYVDPMSGNDANPGTKDKPLRTFEKTAIMVNDSNNPGPTLIKVNPGVYDITETILFKNYPAQPAVNLMQGCLINQSNVSVRRNHNDKTTIENSGSGAYGKGRIGVFYHYRRQGLPADEGYGKYQEHKAFSRPR